MNLNFFNLQIIKLSQSRPEIIKLSRIFSKNRMETSPSYFFCKCSICFDNDSETELINCGDQFCLECLERYVEYWIREASWGVQVGRLACPVCAGELVEEDWMPYVSDALMETWREFERKRSRLLKTFKLTRSCPNCNYDHPIGGLGADLPSTVDAIHQIGGDLSIKLDSIFQDWRSTFDLEVVLDLMHELDALAGDEEWFEAALDCWFDYLELIKRLEDHLPADLIDYLLRFGRSFLAIIEMGLSFGDANESEDQIRAKLLSAQLDYQLVFPYTRCDACGVAFCLPCRKTTWHSHSSSSISSSPKNRICSRCFVPIIKDPEGCNEMNCNFCGFKFCWACGRRWTSSCGIYRCVNAGSGDLSEEEFFEDAIEEGEMGREPEIGVPNVKLLEGRLLKR